MYFWEAPLNFCLHFNFLSFGLKHYRVWKNPGKIKEFVYFLLRIVDGQKFFKLLYSFSSENLILFYFWSFCASTIYSLK